MSHASRELSFFGQILNLPVPLRVEEQYLSHDAGLAA